MNTRQLLISAAIAGVLSALLSSVPVLSLVNCLLCAWLWLGGIFAVWLYGKNTGDTLQSGQGAVLGLVAGFFGAVVASILSAIIGFNTSVIPAETMAQLEQQMGNAADILSDPTTFLIAGIIFNILFYPLFGALGGLLGTAILKPKPVQ